MTAPGRLALGFSFTLAFSWALAGCRSGPQAQAKTRPDALLTLDLVLDRPAARPAAGPDAPRPLLFVDDRLVPLSPQARLAPITLRMPEGPHRIEVRAEGHFPAYAEVTLPADRRARLRLRSDPDASP